MVFHIIWMKSNNIYSSILVSFDQHYLCATCCYVYIFSSLLILTAEFNPTALIFGLSKWFSIICLQCRNCKRRRFHPWVEMIPWRKAWQLILAFLPGEPRGAWWAIIHRVAKRHHWSNIACMHMLAFIYYNVLTVDTYLNGVQMLWMHPLECSQNFFYLINAVNPMVPLSKPTLNQYKQLSWPIIFLFCRISFVKILAFRYNNFTLL